MLGLDQVAKGLILVGVAVLVLGLLILALSRVTGGGRLLPGDIVVQRPGFTFVFPIVTSLALSAVLTLILWLVSALRR